MAARLLIRHATNREHLGRLQIVRPAHRFRKHKNIAADIGTRSVFHRKIRPLRIGVGVRHHWTRKSG
jgi:hypothetical protein